MEEYEETINTLNASAMNFTLETCSLSEQLDNVISKHFSYICVLKRRFLNYFLKINLLLGCRRNRIGFHSFHPGDSRAAWRSVLVLYLLPNASSTRSGFPDRYTRRHAMCHLRHRSVQENKEAIHNR